MPKTGFVASKPICQHHSICLTSDESNYKVLISIFHEGILFKDISYLELWWPLCSAEVNPVCFIALTLARTLWRCLSTQPVQTASLGCGASLCMKTCVIPVFLIHLVVLGNKRVLMVFEKLLKFI